MSKLVYLDFEYCRTNEKYMTIVCGALNYDNKKELYWTFKSPETIERLKAKVNELKDQGYIFISWNSESESSAFYSLGLNPLDYKWYDLYLEYVMFSNHNNDLSKGKQYVKGKEVMIPTWTNEKGPKNLVGATYKLLGVKLDSDHKDKMRDLIISCPDDFTDEERKAISEYCLSDVEYLPQIMGKIQEIAKRMIPRDHRATYAKEAMWRAECAVRTTFIVRHGYPISLQKTRNLADQVPSILLDCAYDINSQFPEIKPFKWNKKDSRFSMDTKALRVWIESQKFKDWERTETNQLSLALEAWEKYFPFRHDFPRNNLGAQILRFLKIQQSLRSFNIKGGSQEKTFFDYVGSDSMVRPYLGQYVAQSSRFQPASTGYLFLKPAFLRSLCEPPKDYLMGSIDYSSQEFLVSALLSGDKKMLEAYIQGDVYLYFAKQAKMVPPNATKESHKKERDLAKATVLGISYSMTKVGLSKKLTSDTGEFVSEEQAQTYIDNFNEVFSVFYEWKQQQLDYYKMRKYLRLPDGFLMFGDNLNDRSVTNCLVQGASACILRKAIQLAQDNGVNVVAPLHDAAYIMFPKNDYTAMDRLYDAMLAAFCFYFEGEAKENAKVIRFEGEVWGEDSDSSITYTTRPMSLTVEKIHIDPRSKKEYSQFSSYFESNNLNLL
jgi:hypothetical protein